MGATTGIFDNMRPKTSKPTLDTVTQKVYASRNACYQELAGSEGMDPTKTLGWYDLCRKYPSRFQDVATGRLIDANGRLGP